MSAASRITPFLMFDDHAEQAIELYTSLFDDGELLEIALYGADGPGREGTVSLATFTLAGQRIMAIDSPVRHEIGHNPYVSMYLECESEEEIRRLYDALSDGGETPMELGDYGFSAAFAWVTDRFGIPWQLNLAHPARARPPADA